MAVPVSPEVVGRDSELRLLCRQLGLDAPAGDLGVGAAPARAVLLAGDAGVGKTRLLAEMADSARAQGRAVLIGHCLDVGGALPYLPFTEILGRLADDHADQVTRALERHPVLARLTPTRRLSTPTPDSEHGPGAAADPRQLFDALHGLLESVAQDSPTIVVLEDLHWADRSTLDLLSFLFARPFAGRVAVVASYRSDELHRRHPLRRQVAEWSRLRAVERIQLEPLGADAVRRLVRLLEPGPVSQATVAAIVQRAEGNAFFVEELVGAGVDGRSLPEDLADLLLVRVDRLGEDARRVVSAAAVAGRRVTHELLAEATGLAPDALEAALREAVDQMVLVPSRQSYAFRHALLAEAVYDDLLPGERVRWHTAYATALASGRLAGAAAELARHARLAGDLPAALAASIEAGDEAAGAGGPDEAAQHYEEALALVGQGADVPGIDLGDLAARAGDALLAAGHTARSVKVLRRHLAQLPDDAAAEARARVLHSLAQALLVADTDDRPDLYSAQAVALLADGDPRRLAQALALHARIEAAEHRADEARQAGLEALTLAERHDLPRVATDVLTTFAQLTPGESELEIAAAFEDAIGQALATGAGNAELRARYQLGRRLQDSGQFAAAAEVFEQAAARGAEFGTPWAPYAFEARVMRVAVLHAAGRWDEALALASVEGESPPTVPEAMLAAERALLLAGRGDPGAADVAEATSPSWAVEGLVALFACSALLAVDEHRGDARAVSATYDRAVETLSRLWHPWFAARLRFATTALGVLGTAAARWSTRERQEWSPRAHELYADGLRVVAGIREAGVEFGPEGLAWAARLDAEWLRWRWAAQLDPPGHEQLLASWRAAQSASERWGSVPDLARLRARMAAVLRAAGLPDEARAAADAAREAAADMGSASVLDELVSLGSAPARPQRGGEQPLTPREREILALVAEGRTNGEIGRQLFISTKTVSVHVSNILAKVGASRRTEAAALARRRGLLD